MTRRVVAVTVAALSAAALDLRAQPAPEASVGPGDHRLWVTAAGLRREYLLHVPSGYRGTVPAPLVLMFHGSGGSIDWDLKATGWFQKAERETFLAVFPNGFPDDQGFRVWNDGRGGADDVAFVRAVLDTLERQLRIDRSRIFVTGFSNGAGLAFRLAVELGDRIAAIAPVSGRLRLAAPVLRRPVPMLFVIGTADPGLGGAGDSAAARRPDLPPSVAAWATLLECPRQPRFMAAEGRVQSRSYGPCRKGSEVVLHTIEGWEHFWPGGRAPGFQMWAENLIWEFFRRHPLH